MGRMISYRTPFLFFLFASASVPRVSAGCTDDIFSLVGCGVLGIGGAAIAVSAAPIALGAVGFSSGGVVACSIAAGTQAGIGNVVAGSTFAVLQSAGAAGLGVGSTAAIGTAGAVGTVAAADTAMGRRRR